MYSTTYHGRYDAGELILPTSCSIDDKSEFENVSRNEILQRGKRFDPLSRLDEFEQRFPLAMKVLELAGVHPTKPREIFDPYKKAIDKSDWRNVGEHCLAVAHAGLQIAEELKRLGILTQEAVERIGERCLVHDAAKRYEGLRRNAAKAGIFVGDAYSASAHEALGNALKGEGLSAELADYLTRSGSETGHLSFRLFVEPLPHAKFKTSTLSISDKIIHLADDMTYTELIEGRSPETMYLIPAERMVAAEFGTRYPWMFKEGLATDSKGKVVDVKDIGNLPENYEPIGTYAYLQPRISGAICHDLRNLIAPGLRPGIISDEDLVLAVVRGEFRSPQV